MQSTSLLQGRRKKKKTPEDEFDPSSPFPFDELSQDLLERVLSWLPVSSFLRLRSVCRRWNSVASSASFLIACSRIPHRNPWFLMVDHELNHSVVYDASEGNWKNLLHPSVVNQSHQPGRIAVAASGGLVCFRDASAGYTICNLVTGAGRHLPAAPTAHPLRAIAMFSSLHKDSYKVAILSGESSHLCFRIFNSENNHWEDEVSLSRKAGNSPDTDTVSGGEAVYFLSKSGELLATNMQRNPSKEFSSVVTAEDGEETVYFLGHSGTVISCNLTRSVFHEYPRLLPIFSEYSIDVVVCKGEMMVVVLSEFLETASLRVWRFSKGRGVWEQVAAMPPAMSHEFYGKRADINCAGCADVIFVCLSCSGYSNYVMLNVVKDEWIELPKPLVKGKPMEFVSALCFEPRLETSV
ncbi:hypothetical protein HPP92_028258 [Vanilla planifolia]|uniref:F-box domain-containing protein n=1 Tax=Vanilla planifolia TaxID=51239 RepID=A0A835U4K1_VANPL|nr:hypothetical protein HPP92_028258 [Vanilla planifolia]